MEENKTQAEDNIEEAAAEDSAADNEAETAENIPEDESDDKGDKKKEFKKKIKQLEKENSELTSEVTEKDKALADLNDRFLRLYAEYDNYRKRTAKEREGIYTDAFSDAIKFILPIIDNLERAEKAAGDNGVGDGVAIIMRSAQDALSKMGITEIPCESFDPNFHNAVMHIEDEQYGEGQIIEVLQKGYMRGDRVIRYAMVKVAN